MRRKKIVIIKVIFVVVFFNLLTLLADFENTIFAEVKSYNKTVTTKQQESKLSEKRQYEKVQSYYVSLRFVATNELSEKEVDVDKAIEEAKLFLKNYPDSEHFAEVQIFLGFIYGHEKKDYAQAIKELDKVIQNYPEDEWLISAAKSEKARFQNELRMILSKKLEFVIKPSKKEYKVGEPWDGELIVTNNSTIDAYIYHGSYYDSWEVRIYVYNDQGKWVSSEYFEYSPSLENDEFLTLKPGESIKINYKIDGYSQADEVIGIEKDVSVDKDSEFFPPGKYTIQAEFMLSAKEKYLETLIEKNLSFGKWPSNSIEVSVISTNNKF